MQYLRTTAGRHIGRLPILFVLLLMGQFQFWDGIITQVFVGCGLVKEANPLVAPLISDGSFLPVKLLGIAALLASIWLLYKRFPRTAIVTASCICAFYMAVVAWNFMVFFHTI